MLLMLTQTYIFQQFDSGSYQGSEIERLRQENAGLNNRDRMAIGALLNPPDVQMTYNSQPPSPQSSRPHNHHSYPDTWAKGRSDNKGLHFYRLSESFSIQQNNHDHSRNGEKGPFRCAYTGCDRASRVIEASKIIIQECTRKRRGRSNVLFLAV